MAVHPRISQDILGYPSTYSDISPFTSNQAGGVCSTVLSVLHTCSMHWPLTCRLVWSQFRLNQGSIFGYLRISQDILEYPRISQYIPFQWIYTGTLLLLDIPSYTELYILHFSILLDMLGCLGISSLVQVLYFLRKRPDFVDGYWIYWDVTRHPNPILVFLQIP